MKESMKTETFLWRDSEREAMLSGIEGVWGYMRTSGIPLSEWDAGTRSDIYKLVVVTTKDLDIPGIQVIVKDGTGKMSEMGGYRMSDWEGRRIQSCSCCRRLYVLDCCRVTIKGEHRDKCSQCYRINRDKVETEQQQTEDRRRVIAAVVFVPLLLLLAVLLTLPPSFAGFLWLLIIMAGITPFIDAASKK